MTRKNLIQNLKNRLEKINSFLDNNDPVNAEIEFDNLDLKMIDLKYLIREELRKQGF